MFSLPQLSTAATTAAAVRNAAIHNSSNDNSVEHQRPHSQIHPTDEDTHHIGVLRNTLSGGADNHQNADYLNDNGSLLYNEFNQFLVNEGATDGLPLLQHRLAVQFKDGAT